ncbi:MAG: heparinase II/III family protein [Acidobacteriota bacterium]
MIPLLLLLLLTACLSLAAENWQSLIRRDHPRLFFNRDTWPAVKAHALGPEAATFAALKARVDELAAKPLEAADYGAQAAEAAFVFLITDEQKYGDLATRLLEASIDFYSRCYAEQRTVNWYSFSRINAWAAFDWLFNRLTPAERSRMGAAFLKAVEGAQPTKTRKAFDRENWGGTNSGFYSTPSLLWYAGLATYRDGINDGMAGQMLTSGYAQFVKLLEFRRHAAADDGGSASGALNYALAAYPWAEFNFFHTYESATGRNIAREWPYVAYLPGYIFWNWLPGGREFGYGDAYHTTNQMRVEGLNIHLSQSLQFYAAAEPECAAFARWLLEKTPRPAAERLPFFFARFLLTAIPNVTPAKDPLARMPMARHFENMGQTLLRSGSGPDDSYALFTAGGVLEQHKHFDHNNFVIYRKGFLAIDTGTRPEPGQHLTHYYSRTVAHNAILIRMPDEQMPRYWGGPAPGEEALPVPNDGGQRRALGSKVVAFETNNDYSYVAGDATVTYDERKCRLALRQFVFLPPDHFVVFDRVSSTRPEYRKTWLLHTVEEPRLAAREFSAVHEQGKLFCRTLLPEKAELAKVGGPGKQFWSDGRNWPLPPGYRTPDTTPLLGQWRVEVSPREGRADDPFLHLIQVGDAGLERMVNARLVRGGGRVGVRFRYGASDWEVLFGTEGPASGHVTLRKSGKLTVDRDLSREVMRQAGVYGVTP